MHPGIAQGIGAAVAKALAVRGLTVAVAKTVERVEHELGAIDYLVNVAGLLYTGGAIDAGDEDWMQSFAVNTHGVFFLTRAAARRDRDRRFQRGLDPARMGMAATAQYIRCLGLELAEYGIRCNLVSPGSTDTEMQRRYWRDGAGSAEQVIRGSLEKFRLGIPLRKLAQPEDIAQAVLFLLSDAAGHITMQDLVVDGGATLG